MDSRAPLAELRNRVNPGQRPKKTYGKQRARRAQGDDLFAPTDENQMEQTFENLKLEEEAIEKSDNKTERQMSSPGTVVPSRHTIQPARKRPPLSEYRVSSHDLNTQLPAHQVQKLESLLSAANQRSLLSFEDFGAKFFKKFSCTKIGEGSFGDVYKFSSNSDDKQPTCQGQVFKIIPVDPEATLETAVASTVHNVLREMKVFEILTGLHGFTQYRGVTVVQGRFPTGFVDAFKDYATRAGREDAQKKDPNLEHPPTRVYAIIEMDDVGVEVGKLQKPSAFQIYDVFWQIAIYLSIAEEQLEFEHRDLHKHNICVRSWKNTGVYDVQDDFVANMEEYPSTRFDHSGIRATIIDYGKARARAGPEATDIISAEVAAWPSNETYQGDTLMQHRTYKKQAALLSRDFSQFVPETNVCWLLYLVSVLTHKVGISNSARYIPGSSKTARVLQKEIWSILQQVQDKLEAEKVKSAKALIEVAVKKNWLSQEELEEFKRRLNEEA